jgi:hypothetical protein
MDVARQMHFHTPRKVETPLDGRPYDCKFFERDHIRTNCMVSHMSLIPVPYGLRVAGDCIHLEEHPDEKLTLIAASYAFPVR